MKKIKKEQGITLIALIITIIVMLILVAVTVQITINGGIFEKAGEAVGKTKNSMKEEEQIIDKWVEKMDRIENGPNAPELIEGMIPVEWNETEKKWVKADVNTDDWYAYGTTEETKKWANAVTVKENATAEVAGSKSRAGYQESQAGTEIKEEDILGMYVWIPRYAYKITKGYNEGSPGEPVYGEVDIKFIGGRKDTISDGNIVAYNADTTGDFTKFPDGYVIHPAFNVDTGSGIKRLTGIWVAKFEASSSNTTKGNENLGDKYGASKLYSDTDLPTVGGEDEVTVRPNVTSWRMISAKNMYIACTNMVKNGNLQGLSTSADSHLMKDTEWGAVAYLTQSKYGNQQTDENTGLWINSYYEGDAIEENGKLSIFDTTRTGMVGEKKDDEIKNTYVKKKGTEKTEEKGKITITYTYKASDVELQELTKEFYEYWTSYGVKGSTTGTIYGVYDLNGGSWEIGASYCIVSVDNNVEIKKVVDWFNSSVKREHKFEYSFPCTSVGSEAAYYKEFLKVNSGVFGVGYYECDRWFTGTKVAPSGVSPFTRKRWDKYWSYLRK